MAVIKRPPLPVRKMNDRKKKCFPRIYCSPTVSRSARHVGHRSTTADVGVPQNETQQQETIRNEPKRSKSGREFTAGTWGRLKRYNSSPGESLLPHPPRVRPKTTARKKTRYFFRDEASLNAIETYILPHPSLCPTPTTQATRPAPVPQHRRTDTDHTDSKAKHTERNPSTLEIEAAPRQKAHGDG